MKEGKLTRQTRQTRIGSRVLHQSLGCEWFAPQTPASDRRMLGALASAIILSGVRETSEKCYDYSMIHFKMEASHDLHD